MLVTCHKCKCEFEKENRHYNYALKKGVMRHFCSVVCAGSAKRRNPVTDPNVIEIRKARAKMLREKRDRENPHLREIRNEKYRLARRQENSKPLTYLSNSVEVPVLIGGLSNAN